MGGLLFGALGGGLAGLATTGGKRNLEVSEIDLRSGKIGYYVYPEEKLENLPTKYRVAVVSSLFNKKRRPITLTLEDGESFLLFPGEHVILPIKTDVCLSSVKDKDPECSTVIVPQDQFVMLYRVVESGRGKFRIDELSDTDAQVFFDRLIKGKEAEAKRVE